MLAQVNKNGTEYKELSSWDILSDEYQTKIEPENLKLKYDYIIGKTKTDFSARSESFKEQFYTKLDKLIRKIFDDKEFARPESIVKVFGAWGTVIKEINPSTFEGFKEYLKFNAENENGRQRYTLYWEEDSEKILGRFIEFQDSEMKDKKYSIKKEFIAEILPLQKSTESLLESIEITEEELKSTDKSLHSEAYILSVNYEELAKTINEVKLQSDKKLETESEQTNQNYRLYMIISSSLGACHPCSLLVSTYPLEQINQQGLEIPITTFFIHDDLQYHSDKSSDHSGKWKISYSDLGDEGTESPDSWGKTLFTPSSNKLQNPDPKATASVKSSMSAQSFHSSSSQGPKK